ncbi:putative xylogalacturonan beta-1,3-xylosyltransferase [Helianthus annuus]|uniref:Putative FRA8-like protein n=1 Tax=Helianthus annuus TaxID=4232 RepID=A0A251SQT0_HELAN|nr:probable glucuronoxylan glucuronosyltransferase F8H [Helianthus annuus]KAF5772679.1 putative xylogalacturonan beta-1,3-xylosyltransferase [Helianthus annuus]KAJ0480410.1 putative xylogalacturonan beta-1,3-xylosyltransferase [Helianthus annuus]KAJ0848500.1 putative xylogalacturonan beta-1,3-xylosyltransferase [Helianthus annuus]KAJ0857494.1 putative xylogalacturonan beta-1,3-xylosyltransferase [Helianthus annuus]
MFNTMAKNRNGFYVKMKFFPTKNPKPEKAKPFFVKHFKWILWFSLSFYFFAKFLNSHETGTSIIKTIKTTTIINHSHRALSESKVDNGLLNGLKVYVYELPSRYNSDWLSNARCRNHLFASEVAVHRALVNSDFRTFDPTDADFFFVPVYVSCNFSTVNGFPAIGHARTLLSSAVEFISTELPFWNRSNGSDHVFVASHDYGACFHAMEDRAMADGIPEFMKNSIILQTFGVKYPHPCQDVEHIVIPPYIPPESVKSTLSKSPIDGQRDIFVFFRGKMEVHPKNVSGRFYSKRVRTEILRKYGNDRRFYLKRHRFAGYQSEIVRSVFCLCPLGWAPWSPRLVESVALGCVPVIIADGIQLPFESTIPWSEISLTVRENDVAKLGSMLDDVATTNLSVIQRNLWDHKLRQAVLFHDDMETGDATWEVLVSLSKKLGRSRRRSRVFSE